MAVKSLNSPFQTQYFQDESGEQIKQTPADCHRTSQLAMGSPSFGGLQSEVVKLPSSDTLKGVPPSTLRDKRMDANPGLRMADAFLSHALPKCAEQLAGKEISDKVHQGFSKVESFDIVNNPSQQNRNTAWRAYAAVMDDPGLAKEFSETFGVNNHIGPQVGDGLVQVNNPIEKTTAETEDRDLWNFHYAGVVGTDGKDYVTVENLATDNPDEVNSSWKHRIFNTDGNSDCNFHSWNAKMDSHVGKYSLTLVVKNDPALARESLERPSQPKVKAPAGLAALFGNRTPG